MATQLLLTIAVGRTYLAPYSAPYHPPYHPKYHTKYHTNCLRGSTSIRVAAYHSCTYLGLHIWQLPYSRAGFERVLIPAKNAHDLADIPESVRAELEIHLVGAMDQVLELALEPAPLRAPLPTPPSRDADLNPAAA